MDCAFKGHLYRFNICEDDAYSFLKTTTGTLWPLCPACCERHKKTLASLVASNQLPVATAMGSRFDIPLSDPQSLRQYHHQDPQAIQSAIEAADQTVGKKSA